MRLIAEQQTIKSDETTVHPLTRTVSPQHLLLAVLSRETKFLVGVSETVAE